MKFQPKSEEEVSNLIPKGEYPFEVLSAEEKTSKSGNDMIALKIGVAYNDATRGVFDYLVDLESMAYKTRHFADSVGLLADYEKGSLDADKLPGLTGKCRIDIQPAKDGYDAKNVVKDYVKGSGAVAAAPAKKGETVKDDDIPW